MGNNAKACRSYSYHAEQFKILQFVIPRSFRKCTSNKEVSGDESRHINLCAGSSVDTNFPCLLGMSSNTFEIPLRQPRGMELNSTGPVGGSG
jgi:hypothetical protein